METLANSGGSFCNRLTPDLNRFGKQNIINYPSIKTNICSLILNKHICTCTCIIIYLSVQINIRVKIAMESNRFILGYMSICPEITQLESQRVLFNPFNY